MKKGMSKKGLSDVVTTVLIILIAIAAVAVVGGIVLNQIKKGGDSINKASVCTDNVIEPISCKQTITGTSSVTNVGVMRKSGSLNLNVANTVSISLEATDGSMASKDLTSANFANAGSSASLAFSNAEFSATKTAKQARVSAVYTSLPGFPATETQTCVSQPITCTR